MKRDTYQTVTDSIVRQLKAGVRPWNKPWSGGMPVMPMRSNGEPYRGVNVLLLWGAAEDNGFTGRHWLTFNQAKALGASVKKGSKATAIVYYGKFTPGEGEDDREIPFLKTYSVFNADQIDGLPEHLATAEPINVNSPERIASADAWAKATGATIQHGGNRAFFSPSHDLVQMPPFAAFVDAPSYYGTLAHELTHWTGHTSRLDRTFGKRFGDRAYAVEELVAELGAAFAMARLGIAADPRPDHASYLASWLDVLKADKRAIFTAASKAQAACDHLFELAGSEAGAVVRPVAPVAVVSEPVAAKEPATANDPGDDDGPNGGGAAIALAAYRRACDSRARADWRNAAHALALEVERLEKELAKRADFRAVEPQEPEPAPMEPEPFDGSVVPFPDDLPPRARKGRADLTLCEFLALRGVVDTGGELRSIDADSWHQEKPFRRKLIREGGMALDDAAYAAWEAGFFPDVAAPSWDASDNMNPISPDMLIRAIERELREDYRHVWGHDEAWAA
jgi:antirestriction protein ArdC